MSTHPVLREGTLGEVSHLADAFRQMWLDNAVAPDAIEPDFRERVERFVREGRVVARLRFFLAERPSPGGHAEVVGAACCQLFTGLYPAILEPGVRQYGYVWGVYVAPNERRRGLGRALTERCIDALEEIGCTHVLLHAAPPGRGVYATLGFESTNELRLTLSRRAPR